MDKAGKIHMLKNELINLNREMLQRGLTTSDLQQFLCSNSGSKEPIFIWSKPYGIVFLSILVCFVASTCVFNYMMGFRCLVSNNYLVWEATRPISDCSFCIGVTKPTILHNVSKKDFNDYAYSSTPIIVKRAAKHWKATEMFSYEMFKDLYEHTNGAYQSVEEGCQFLHFRSDLFTLKQVFSMSSDRAHNEKGEKPWYVGWGNCHPQILETVRQYYSYPEFLPDDVEMPNSENIFFGYEEGAVLHLDYIPRLMWQGQVKGNKTWQLVPIPECENVCESFTFYVEAGDVVFLDTRVWYHATTIPKGQFSLTVQSEYG